MNKKYPVNWVYYILGLAAIIIPASAFVMMASLDAVQAGITPLIKTVSDLVHGPYGWLQNLVFSLLGVGLLSFIIKLFAFTRKKISSLAGTSLFALTVAGFLLIPAFPSQAPGLDVPLQALMHNSIAGVISGSFMLGCIAFAVHFRKDPHWNRYWVYTAVTAVLCLGFALMWALMPRELHMEGLGERLLLFSGFTWIAVISVKLLRLFRQSRRLIPVPVA